MSIVRRRAAYGTPSVSGVLVRLETRRNGEEMSIPRIVLSLADGVMDVENPNSTFPCPFPWWVDVGLMGSRDIVAARGDEENVRASERMRSCSGM